MHECKINLIEMDDLELYKISSENVSSVKLASIIVNAFTNEFSFGTTSSVYFYKVQLYLQLGGARERKKSIFT